MKKKTEIKISRSKIDLFIECPRCFWLEVKHNIKRPEKFSSAHIGSKYDPLLKRIFDEHRKINKKPPELEDLDFELYPDLNKLNIWRKGVEYYHPKHNITYYGKIDDLLITKEKDLVPLDFKTTLSKDFNVYDSYKRELEIYGYFLRKQGEKVLDIGVLYFVRIDINEKFEKIEERKILTIENLNYEIYDEILENLKETYFSEKEPLPNPNCEFCKRDFEIIKLFK